MPQAMYNQVKDFNKSLYTATKQMMDINVRSYERLIQEQFTLVGRCLEDTVKQLEMVRDAKDIPGYLTAQSEQLQKWSEHLKLFVNGNMKIVSETHDEFDSMRKKDFFKVPSPNSVPYRKAN